MTIYADYCDAWNLDFCFYNGDKEYPTLENSCVLKEVYCIKVINNFTYNLSKIKQEIILRENSFFIEINNNIDWLETNKMLRVETQPLFNCEYTNCGIQLGVISRKAVLENLEQTAQFEMPF